MEIHESKDCIVCFEPLQVLDTIIFSCGHKCIHATCFAKSIIATGKAMCPLCRKMIVDESSAPLHIHPLHAMMTRIFLVSMESLGNVELIPSEENDPLPPHPSVQCNGIRSNGERCKRRTRDLSGYCNVHRQNQQT